MMKKFFYNIMLIKRGINIIWKIEKSYLLFLILTSVLNSLIPYINIYMIANIIDALSMHASVQILVWLVSVTVLLNAAGNLCVYGFSRIRDYHLEQFYKNEQQFLSEKSMALAFPIIEDNKTTLLRGHISAESQMGYNMYYLYTFFGQTIESITNILASIVLSIGIFFNTNINLLVRIMLLVLIITTIFIRYFSSQHSNTLLEKSFKKFVPYNSRYNFYSNYLHDYNSGKDIRVYQLADYLYTRQYNDDLATNEILKDTRKKMMPYQLLTTCSTDALKIFLYIIVTLACLSSAISLGSITQYVSSLALLVSGISNLIAQLQSLFFNNKYLEHYFQYLNLPESVSQGNLSITASNIESIEFKHVFFRYPNTNTDVLKDINLKIIPGQRLAIVGINGSGKTTLIKLLCGFYKPTQGVITINDIDLNKYKERDYQKLLGVVFQDYKLFSLSLAENIAASSTYDKFRIKNILSELGLESFLTSLPQKENTPLYHDYDKNGYEISGGEAQRIAFARALYKNSPLLILDEPTAALDPLTEAKIYTQFDQLTKGKTTIYISHRMASCRFCDQIAVFHEGELVQYGPHTQLIKETNGKYFELWSAQAQYYSK